MCTQAPQHIQPIPDEKAEHKAMSILQRKAGCQVPGVKRHEPKGPACPPGLCRERGDAAGSSCKEWSGALRAAGLAAGGLAAAKDDKRGT